MSLLGLEIGATRCRATAFSLEGTPLAEAHRDYGVITGPGGVREIEAGRVWAAARSVVGEVASQSRRDPIRAVSVSTLGEAMVPLSADGEILGHCVLGSDQRGTSYVEEVERSLGAQRLFDITGNLADASCALPKLCWLRDNEPRLFAGTWRFVSLGGLVYHFLGGVSMSDYSWAGRTLLFDQDRESWSAEVLRACGLPEAKLPGLARAGASVGTVSPGLSRELGLAPGVRMVLGGEDYCCRALGAGAIQSGMALYELGANIHAMPAFEAIPLTSLLLSHGLNIGHHVVPGLFASLLRSASGGNVLRWFRDNLAPLEKRLAQRRGTSVYDELLAEMPETPTRLMVLPEFVPGGPSRFDAGPSGAILGLKVDTTRGEVVKALLEGMTYPFVGGQELLGQVGVRLQTYRATGGGARSERWLQLTSDVLNRPVERTGTIETGTLGAAILAGVGTDAYASFEEAVATVVSVQRRFEPDPGRRAAYAARHERYAELHPLLRDYLHRLDET